MFSKNHVMSSMFGVVVASTFMVGCAGEPLAADDPATGEVASALAGTTPVPMIAINFNTGSDDKRSDSRVWVQVDLNNGNTAFQEVVPGATLPNWSWSGWQYLSLPSGTRNMDIRDIQIFWQQGGGGWNGDNWNLQSVPIYALDGTTGQWSFQEQPGGNPLVRFTGSVTQIALTWFQ